MRRIPLCLVVPFVLACGLVGPGEPTIRLEGTVTALDDGSPVPGASISVHFTEGFLFIANTTVASVTTDASGRYALSFETEGGCKVYILTASAARFMPVELRSIQCTDKVQTINVQLQRPT